MRYKILVGHIKLAVILLLVPAILFTSCKKSETIDKYYIKYEVNSSSVYTGGKLSVAVSDKDSIKNFLINTKTSWETVIGPVEKGFLATLGVSKSGTTDNTLKLYTQISVSINNEPFVLKKIDGSDVPRNSVYISYNVGN